jgi:hypothetical protein
MAIVKKEVTAARESTSTHFPNETTEAPEDSGQSVLNNQVPETLIDPEDDEGGSTHFNNEETYNAKSKKQNGGKTTAAAEPAKVATEKAAGKKPKHPGEVPLAAESAKKHPAKAKTTKAALEDLDAPAGGVDLDGDFAAGGPDSGTGVEADGEGETGLQDTQHMPNDEDPAAGYLEVGEAPLDGETGQDHAGGAGVDLEGANPQSGLEVEGAEEEVVDEFDDAPEAIVPEGEPEIVEDDEIEGEDAPAIPAAGGDEMPIVDVDGADDEGDDVVFANIGTSVKVIKANRIVASMSKKVAVKAGHSDVYLGEQFQEVTTVEMSKHGLRAGLKKMGFVLASVNLGRAEVLNKRVEAKANKLTAAVRSQVVAENKALEQCMAIAAVGVNKGYFKDTRNELRAALEAELEAAGVRGAKRLVANVFATKGIDYSKSIITVAKKLSALSEDVRNQHAAALDMVGDEGIDDESDLMGDSAAPDFQSEMAGGEEPADSDDFVDEFEADDGAPQTVHAALTRPAYATRTRSEVSAKATGYSVTAAAILQGKAPFPFA